MIPVVVAQQAVRHRRKIVKVVAIGLAAQFCVLVLPLAIILGADTGGTPVAAADGCTVVDGQPVTLPAGLDETQAQNASAIIAIGKGLNIPPKGWTIAVATSLVESEARNLASRAVPESMLYPNDGVAPGDHDSINLFQQRRPWWGPGGVKDGMNRDLAIKHFYTGGATGQPGLLDIKGWESMPLGVAAQKVQRSAFPTRYAGREQQAATIVAALSGVTAGVCTVQPGGTGPWRTPLAKGSYTITSPFGPRNMGDGTHSGTDLGATCGTPIFAASAGRVIHAGPTSGSMWSYGNLTEIDHGGGVHARYGHQSQIVVKAGQSVTVGQRIGSVGNTGNSFGCHLHFQIILNGKDIDPEPFMAQKGATL